MCPRPRSQRASPRPRRRGLRVLHIASELAPAVDLTGLGGILAELTAAQQGLDLDVAVVAPRYLETSPERWNLARRLAPLRLADGTDVTVHDGVAPAGAPRVTLVDHPRHPRLAHPPAPGPATAALAAEAAARSDLLCRAAAAIARQHGGWPHVLHGHDAAAAGAAAAFAAASGPGHPMPAIVLTLYDMPPAPELAATIDAAHAITSASPRFVRDVAAAAAADDDDDDDDDAVAGALGPTLAAKAGALHSVVHGAGSAWSPERDPHLVASYSTRDWTGKSRCKRALQDELGLPGRAETPLIAVVDPSDGRGDGAPAVAPAELASQLWRSGAQLAVLATGDDGPSAWPGLAERLSTRVAFRRSRDAGLAHRLIAGADFYLVAPRLDPRAQNALYGMRYGTIPLVPCDSPLAELVVDFDPGSGTGSAICFGELGRGVRRAARAFRHAAFGAIARQAMRTDLSWATAAARYHRVYRDAIAALPSPRTPSADGPAHAATAPV